MRTMAAVNKQIIKCNYFIKYDNRRKLFLKNNLTDLQLCNKGSKK